MKKSCSYCGRVHPQGYVCPMKPKKFKHKSSIDRFRSSAVWQKKRRSIAERDLHLCRICLEKGIFCSEIQVHHIIPIAVDYSKRLDDDNLISLCSADHELAEKGAISSDRLRQLAASPPCRESFSGEAF